MRPNAAMRIKPKVVTFICYHKAPKMSSVRANFFGAVCDVWCGSQIAERKQIFVTEICRKAMP